MTNGMNQGEQVFVPLPESTLAALASNRNRPDEKLAEVIDRLIKPKAADPLSVKKCGNTTAAERQQSSLRADLRANNIERKAKYELTVLGEKFGCKTLGDCLIQALRTLGDWTATFSKSSALSKAVNAPTSRVHRTPSILAARTLTKSIRKSFGRTLVGG